MLPSGKCKKIKIHITTYSHKKSRQKGDEVGEMCDHSCRKNIKDRTFICPLCFSDETTDVTEKQVENLPCPFCHKKEICITDAFTCSELKVIDFKDNKDERECFCNENAPNRSSFEHERKCKARKSNFSGQIKSEMLNDFDNSIATNTNSSKMKMIKHLDDEDRMATNRMNSRTKPGKSVEDEATMATDSVNSRTKSGKRVQDEATLATDSINSRTKPGKHLEDEVRIATNRINSRTKPNKRVEDEDIMATESINTRTKPGKHLEDEVRIATNRINSRTKPSKRVEDYDIMATESINSRTKPVKRVEDEATMATDSINSRTKPRNYVEDETESINSRTKPGKRVKDEDRMATDSINSRRKPGKRIEDEARMTINNINRKTRPIKYFDDDSTANDKNNTKIKLGKIVEDDINPTTNKNKNRIKPVKHAKEDFNNNTRKNRGNANLDDEDSGSISKYVVEDEVVEEPPSCCRYAVCEDVKRPQSCCKYNECEDVKEPPSCCRYKTKCSNKTNANELKVANTIVDAVCQTPGPYPIAEIGDRGAITVSYEQSKVVHTQTSKAQIDMNNGLHLLNEVLTVFQNKKCDPKSCDCKSVLECKDASIQTIEGTKRNIKSLSMSKLTKYSINEEDTLRDEPLTAFVILESRQPDGNLSKSSLPKYKSSSIPQMKLEELKYSMRERNKSKDTVDEVNRMFAVVGKYEKDSKDDSNRPSVRNGPRILPVVKTVVNQSREPKDDMSEQSNNQDNTPKYTKRNEKKDNYSEICDSQLNVAKFKETRDNFSEVSNSHHVKFKTCKTCQTNDYYMSGGDSKESCRSGDEEKRCEKCVYMLSCCHNRTREGLVVCECCRKRNNNCRCSREDCLASEEF